MDRGKIFLSIMKNVAEMSGIKREREIERYIYRNIREREGERDIYI